MRIFAAQKQPFIMKRYIITLLLNFLVLTCMMGQQVVRLELPHHEQLSSERVLQVIQDSEGFLWYATEGGGVCRDDGRQILVFRSDAEHPDLLGSNDVACLAEAAGRYILIGTFHGACVMDKQDNLLYIYMIKGTLPSKRSLFYLPMFCLQLANLRSR